MHKLLCKLKGRETTDGKNNIAYENDCRNCKEVFFGESKRSLKSESDEHEKSVKTCDCENNEIAKHCCDEDWFLASTKRHLLIAKAG